MLTRALATELSRDGIHVNAISPGNTETPMNDYVRNDPEFKPILDFMQKLTPSGRTYSKAEDQADFHGPFVDTEKKVVSGKELGRSATAHKQRRTVTGVDVRQVARTGVQQAEENTDELVRWSVQTDVPVDVGCELLQVRLVA